VRRIALAVLVLLGAVLLLGIIVSSWTGDDGRGPHERRFALSPQECNTECQSRQTDCIEDCDGNIPCERRCTETGLRCVARCSGHGPDAGSGGAGGGGGAAGAAGAAGRGGVAGAAGAGRGGAGGGGNGGQAGAP
jgi:hypothetical protein